MTRSPTGATTFQTTQATPPNRRRFATLLNCTATSYHWGCHATSMEIHDTLVERGHVVTRINVETIHRLAPTPVRVDDLDAIDFANRLFDAQPALFDALRDADLIVVNGEGTLHRDRPAARNLLYLMYAARRYLDKNVRLINHSFFPGGGDDSGPLDVLYGGVARTLTHVVPRDPRSLAILERLGVTATLGFDCLPRHLDRLGVGETIGGNAIVLAGGVNMNERAAKLVAKHAARTGRPIRFLTGAHARPAAEDAVIFQWMREVAPALEWEAAADLMTWVAVIKDAALMVSARFHHTIAAMSLGVPSVCLSSNTPKIDAVRTFLDLPTSLDLTVDDDEAAGRVQAAIQAALDGAAVPTSARRGQMRDLAARNFDGVQHGPTTAALVRTP